MFLCDKIIESVKNNEFFVRCVWWGGLCHVMSAMAVRQRCCLQISSFHSTYLLIFKEARTQKEHWTCDSKRICRNTIVLEANLSKCLLSQMRVLSDCKVTDRQCNKAWTMNKSHLKSQ